MIAGCSSRPPSPPSQTESVAPPSGHGTYKVGSPYQIAGVWYYPAEDYSYDETGIASWYGEDFDHKYTSNGELFDVNGLTGAHRTLPLPSIVQVTNLENGRSIQVRVNDRGPFARGRIIDVSRRAAQLLGFESTGTARVRVRILAPESLQAASLAGRHGSPDVRAAETPQAAPRVAVAAQSLPPQSANVAAAPAASVSDKVVVVPVRATQIYIQAGAYSRADNALRAKGKIDRLGPVQIVGAQVNGADFYRVRLGPIATVGEADRILDRVVESGLSEARIVVD